MATLRANPSRRATACALVLLSLLAACGGDKGATGPDKPVASLTLANVPTGAVLAGSVLPLLATPRDASGNALLGRAVTWASSDTLVAKVSESGTVSSVAAGVATITASSEGKSAEAKLDFREGGVLGPEGGMLTASGGAVALSVQPAAMSKATIVMFRRASGAPTPANLVAGTAFEIVPAAQTFGAGMARVGIRFPFATGFDTASLQLGVLDNGVWKLVDGTVADAATRTIWAPVTKLGIYGIISAPVDHLTISGAPVGGKIYIGQAAQLSVQAYDAANNQLTGRAVSWTTSDASVATVTSYGRVVAVGAGSAVITATVEGKTATATFNPVPVPVAIITLTPSSLAVYPQQAAAIVAQTRDSAGGVLTGRTLTWSSSDATHATVDANGVVHGVAPGSATITAKADGVSATAQVLVLPRPVADWSQAAEWTTYQGNAAHSGYVAATLDPVQFHDLWTVAIGGTPNPVTAGGGHVFVSTNAYFGTQLLRVLDATTGAAQWTKDFGAIHGVHPPAYGNGRVYVTTSGHQDSFLWGFDAASGELQMHTAYGNQWSRYYAPVVTADAVYMAGGYYDGMYAFNADGTQRWFFSTNQYDQWTPAVRDGVVYAYTGSYNPMLSAVDAVTGAKLFDIQDANFSWDGWSMNVSLALGSQSDALATHDGRLISFDLAAHTIRWQRSGGYVGQVTVAANTIYAVANGQLEARKESDGSTQWLWVPPEGRATAPVIATDNLLFVSTAANTYAIDIASHRQVWSYPAGGALALSAEGLLLIARADGKLTAIAAR